MYNKDYKTIIHKVKDLRRYPGFNPINFTFSENSNYGREVWGVKANHCWLLATNF